jgi:hypothetical protein
MKTLIIAGVTALTVLSAIPVAAQPAPGWNNGGAYNGGRNNGGGWNRDAFWRDAPANTYERITFLQRRIDRGISDGSLDRREARRSQTELNTIRRQADQFRYRDRGGLSPAHSDVIQARLDDLSQRLRWQRGNGAYAGGNGAYAGGNGAYAGGNGAYAGGNPPPPPPGDYDRRFATDYDATRDYRDGPQYNERKLAASDQVYRGSDGRYYCKRNDGTTGLIIGGVGGGVLGNVIDGGHNRVAGTLIGGALGALAGQAIERNNDVRCR